MHGHAGFYLDWLQRAASTWLPLLGDASVKGFALLIVGGSIVLAMRKASAAARQTVWVLAMASLLALPILSATLPAWQVLPDWLRLELQPGAPPAAGEQVAVEPETPPRTDEPFATELPAQAEAAPQVAALSGEPPDTSDHAEPPPVEVAATPAVPPAARDSSPQGSLPAMLLPWVLPIWAAGAVACLAPLVLGRLSLLRLERSAQRIASGTWMSLLRRAMCQLKLTPPVVLLESRHRTMPMVWGLRRVKLLLPAEATAWSADRRYTVLLHELAHAKRHDCLGKLVAHLAAALYWFNPLAWLAMKRLTVEAETACDDLVLSAGRKASDYAEHLLEIASGLKAGMLAAYSSIAMARASRLENRLLAILDERRNRRRLTAAGVALAVLLLAGIVLPLSVLHAAASGSKQAKETTQAIVPGMQADSQRKTSRLVIGPNYVEFQGHRAGAAELPALLADVPDRANTTLEIAGASGTMLIEDFRKVQGPAMNLAKSLGYAGTSYVGVQTPNTVATSINGIEKAPATHPGGSKLEFHIALYYAYGSEWEAARKAEYDTWLKRLGQKRIPGQGYDWFPLDEKAEKNRIIPGCISAERDGRTYLLLSNTPGQVMLKEDGLPIWGLESVYRTTDAEKRPAVGFRFDDRGSELFLDLTKRNLHKNLAIILDGRVLSVGKVMSPIHGEGIITGQFTQQEVDNLIESLRIGMPPVANPLPLPVAMRASGSEPRRNVYIVGSVRRPGVYSFPRDRQPPLTLRNLLAATGVQTETKGLSAQVLRATPDGANQRFAVDVDALLAGTVADPPLQENDLVLVQPADRWNPTVQKNPTSSSVKIIGKVERPGDYSVNGAKVTLSRMLAGAGFDLTKVQQTRITVLRRKDGNEQTPISVELSGVLNGTVPDFEIVPGDVIAVTLAPLPTTSPGSPATQVGRWQASLSDGSTVQLVGISNLHLEPKQWWNPDGTPLAEPPYPGMKDADEQYQYEFVMRLTGPADATDNWNVPGGNFSTNRGRPKGEDGRPIEDLRVLGVGFRQAPGATTIHYGVATGKWESKATYDRESFASEKAFSWPGGGIVVNPPQDANGVTELGVAFTPIESSYRLVAVARDGRVIEPFSLSGVGVTGLASRTAKFSVPLRVIERFEFQTRPYEWVEFKNVSLRPGQQTDVQVTTSPLGPAEGF